MPFDMEDQRHLLPDDDPSSTATTAAVEPDPAIFIQHDRKDNLPPASTDEVDNEEVSVDDEEEIIKRLHTTSFDTSVSSSDRDFAERTLPEDTFSFLIYSDVYGRCFLWAILVFSFQISIYIILGVNIIDIGNKKNPVGFPINVDIPVRISEVIAILISMITQSDVRKAICLYRDGFDEGGITQEFEGATLWKWTLSIVLRASEGLLGLSITFLLIMRSSSVLDLLLNFSAIEFVTMLDDTVFELASEGFLGRTMKRETKRLSRKSYFVNHECANSQSAVIVSILYFVVLFASFFGGWGYIFWQQWNGHYLCKQIFSQFGDEVLPMLGTYTGLFYRHKMKIGRRLTYRNDKVPGPLLAYCEDEKRWTLSLIKDEQNTTAWNPCKWTAASSESEDYSILSTASSPWVIKTPTNRTAPLTHNYLACYECRNVDGFCGVGSCISREYDQCDCNVGKGDHYGLRCEYPKPCKTVEVNARVESFPNAASTYYLLEGATSYDRPIYTSLGDNQSLSDGTALVLFNGIRWIVSYKYLFPGLVNITDKVKLITYFKKDFNGHFTNYSFSYESEPVYYEDIPGAGSVAAPLKVKWRPHSASDDIDTQGTQRGFLETELLCTDKCKKNEDCFGEAICSNYGCTAKCEADNDCTGGKCSNGTCGECPNEYSGSRCEIPPKFLSDGHCDSRFNSEEFNFDGGDCCDNTCKSTLENTCGKALGQEYIDTGYPFCASNSSQWELSGNPIFGMSSASRSGHVVALSGKGNVLAVADPTMAIVRLFDKDGADWRQRGPLIQGVYNSRFGSSISLSDESVNVVQNPLSAPTVTLAVGAPKIGLVRIFTCSTVGCIQKGDDIIGIGGESLSLSNGGDSIAIGGASRETLSQRASANGEVKVFTWSNNAWEKKGTVNTLSSSRKLSDSYQFGLQGYYVSLSGDNLAVGTLEGEVTNGTEFGSVKLLTQVYKWDNSTGIWNQLGDVMKNAFSEGDSWPLQPIVIKGNVLAVGSNSSVDVYSWDEQKWSPREVNLTTTSESDSFVGWSIDLSEDANTLAVGNSIENRQPSDKPIQMYEWDSRRQSYEPKYNGLPGGKSVYLSLASDGNAVAVGSPFDLNGGSTRVYNFYPKSLCENSTVLRMSFTTDDKPDETSWELQVDEELKWSSGSLSEHPYTTFVEQMCIPDKSSVRFVVKDSQGDGLNPPGVFALMLDGKEVVRSGDFACSKCCEVTITDSEPYEVTSCESYDTPPPYCEEGNDIVAIDITLGEEPWDAYWEVVNPREDNAIVFDGPYQVAGGRVVKKFCKPVDACYWFRLETTDDTSAEIYLDNKLIAKATTNSIAGIGDCEDCAKQDCGGV